MWALLLNLVSCQSLRSLRSRRLEVVATRKKRARKKETRVSLASLVESILGDPVGPGEKARRKFSNTGGRALPSMLEKTENFRRAFSPDWLPLGVRGCVENNRLCVVCVWEPDASYLINRVNFDPSCLSFLFWEGWEIGSCTIGWCFLDILNSARRILQCWSYHVKVNSARH